MKTLLDQTAQTMLQAFKGCRLIPVAIGLDPNDAPVPLATEIQSPAFRSRLAVQNVAVLLGQSDGLLAVCLDNEAAMEQLMVNNPAIRGTLTTEHNGQPVVWLRASVAHRALLHLPGITVQMRGGILLVDRTRLARTDRIVSQGAPMMINPETLNFGPDPGGRVDLWLTRLSHGEFFRRNLRGQVIPNRRAWFNYLIRRLRPGLAFELGERQFYERGIEDTWRPVSEEQLRPRLRELIVMASVEAPEAKARLSDEWLSKMCRGLKSSLAVHLPMVETRLRGFAAEFLAKRPGVSMTNAELTAAFTAHCRQAGQPPLSPMKFKVLIGRVLRGEPWGLCYSKSIQRTGGQQNGWRGLMLKHAIMTPSGDGGADGADGVAI